MERGDYVKTAGLSEDEYDEVVQAIKNAGASGADFSQPRRIGERYFLVWDDEDDIDAGPSLHRASGREVSIDDLIKRH
ncbi:hypothetical protein [Salinicola peritrichatus]|uniref:hypothetical protein n=1 Tax=Salinicola peritrichatus TaxID=1267424 RepID=UPI0013A647CA|nr:hypothetical protein [Salinicola peritrichatus]